MCCAPLCLTSCMGSNCGFCSECVGSAGCATTLCSGCLTGTQTASGDGMCGPVAGTNASICTNTDVCALLPYAGMDGNGNEIYQNKDGSLVYSDGSPATQGDIACNQGACVCTPCSPRTCGSTDQPPNANGSGKAAGAPQGGGSGGGTAKPAGGSTNPQNCAVSKLSQAMNRFGSTLSNLLAGGKKNTAAGTIPGQKVPVAVAPMSSNTFLLILVVIGGLLLWLAFGHKPEGE
jgi:hypothetical protein